MAGRARMADIHTEIDRLTAQPVAEARAEGKALIAEFRDGLNQGRYRAAEKVDGVWQTHAWVKRGTWPAQDSCKLPFPG